MKPTYDEFYIKEIKTKYTREFGEIYEDITRKEIARGSYAEMNRLYQKYRASEKEDAYSKVRYVCLSIGIVNYIRKHNNNKTDFYFKTKELSTSHFIHTSQIRDKLNSLINECKTNPTTKYYDEEYIDYTKFVNLVKAAYPGYKPLGLGDVYSYDKSFDNKDNITVIRDEMYKTTSKIVIVGIYGDI